MTLISSLLTACKLELTPGDAESDSSSVEVLRTLTSHLTPPSDKDAHQNAIGVDSHVRKFIRFGCLDT